MQEIVPQDRRPPLPGRRPQFQTLDQVRDAIRLIAWFRSRQQTVDEVEKQSVRLLKETSRKETTIDVDGERLAFAAYVAELEQSISAYCDAHPGLFAERRTIEFPAGDLLLRRQPLAIELAQGTTEADHLQAVIASHDLTARTTQWLKRSKLWPYLRLKVEFNRAEINRAFAAGDISREDLQAWGFEVVDPHDEVSVKPRVGRKAAASEAAA